AALPEPARAELSVVRPGAAGNRLPAHGGCRRDDRRAAVLVPLRRLPHGGGRPPAAAGPARGALAVPGPGRPAARTRQAAAEPSGGLAARHPVRPRGALRRPLAADPGAVAAR